MSVDIHGHLETYLAVWETHDPDRTAALYAPHAVMDDPTLRSPLRGRAAIHRYFAHLFASLRQPERELLDWVERHDRVWFEWALISDGVRRTGASIQTLEDGLIVHDISYWNPNGG